MAAAPLRKLPLIIEGALPSCVDLSLADLSLVILKAHLALDLCLAIKRKANDLNLFPTLFSFPPQAFSCLSLGPLRILQHSAQWFWRSPALPGLDRCGFWWWRRWCWRNSTLDQEVLEDFLFRHIGY